MKRQIFIRPDTKIARLGGRPPRVTLILLLVQVGLFVAWAFANAPPWVSEYLATSAAHCLRELALWQPFTALWLHLGSRGMLLDGLALWIFGPPLEHWWGGRRFLLYYVVTGVAGLFLGTCFGLLQPTHALSGAAGASLALILALGFIFPGHLLFFFGVLPLKAKHLALVALGFILLGSLLGGDYLEIAVQLGGGLAALPFLLRRPPGARPPRRAAGKAGKGGKGGLTVLPGGKSDKPRYWN